MSPQPKIRLNNEPEFCLARNFRETQFNEGLIEVQ